MRRYPLSRRTFLATTVRAGLGAAACSVLPPFARTGLAAATPTPDMIERSDRPEQWESTLASLDRGLLTPNALFFVRSHFPAPEIDPATWRLEITGKVSTPLSLSLADIMSMPRQRDVCVLECAGNGRGLMPLPSTSGTQWEYGAVGCAEWDGVFLSGLLKRAGVLPDAKHVWFECADQAPLPQTPKFVRSIPIEKAMKDVLLAHTMNREPLPNLHGFPLRAIVPGWYGMASSKWLTTIRVESAPSDNHFMVRGYRYNAPGADPVGAAPVQEVRVKSLMTWPREGDRIRPGMFTLRGYAWGGNGGVWMVETSIDEGANWFPAEIRSSVETHGWRQWKSQSTFEAAPVTVLIRATDHASTRQPVSPPINAGGYGNNMIQRVNFSVGG